MAWPLQAKHSYQPHIILQLLIKVLELPFRAPYSFGMETPLSPFDYGQTSNVPGQRECPGDFLPGAVLASHLKSPLFVRESVEGRKGE